MLGRFRQRIDGLWSMASTTQERLDVLRFLAFTALARLLPIDTAGWSTTLRVSGVEHRVGLRTAETAALDHVYGRRLYERLDGYVAQPGWVVVDLGANVGAQAVRAAQRGAVVHAIEPNPECAERIRWTARRHRLDDRVVVHPVAASDRNGSAWLRVDDGETWGGRVTDTRPTSGVAIDLARVDDALADHELPAIDLLTVDVGGDEIVALRGASRTLARTRRIIVEYHSVDRRRALLQILWANDFEEDLRLVDTEVGLDAEGRVGEVGVLYASRRARRSRRVVSL